MTISARVIADSIYEGGPRLTTFVLRYPRFIHSEFMTHRVFSRNAASSRAIPVQKMIQAVKDDPAIPIHWGRNQPGMQADEELDPETRLIAEVEWLRARDYAIEQAQRLLNLGLHKQIANRILEPWMHIEVVFTSTDFANFYGLRNHKDAQPEFKELARQTLEAHRASTPRVLKPGQWHLPFITKEDERRIQEVVDPEMGHAWAFVRVLAKTSAARCARVSYMKHDGTNATVEEDLALFDRLMGGNPKHASPTEHQARVPTPEDYYQAPEFEEFMYPSNLRGWVQFRKLIQGECITNYEEFNDG